MYYFYFFICFLEVIQIDEAALREGLPLRKSEHAFYLDWAVHSFRITNCGIKDTTQVTIFFLNSSYPLNFFSGIGMILIIPKCLIMVLNIISVWCTTYYCYKVQRRPKILIKLLLS
jgi:methionine synthase II (cobalamin-independent)